MATGHSGAALALTHQLFGSYVGHIGYRAFRRRISVRPASHDHAVRNSRPLSSSCVVLIHNCVILLVITTVIEAPIWPASVAQLTKVCGFIGRR
jgi:hypothetical protein